MLRRWFIASLVPVLAAATPAHRKSEPRADDRQRIEVVEGAPAKLDRALFDKGVHYAVPKELARLAHDGATLKKMLFGKEGRLTSDSWTDIKQSEAGDCYSQSTRDELMKLDYRSQMTRFRAIVTEDGKLVSKPIANGFKPELAEDGSFKVGVIRWKHAEDGKDDLVPYVRVVTTRFPVNDKGTLLPASVKEGRFWALIAEQARADDKGSWKAYANGGDAAEELTAETGERGTLHNLKLEGPKAVRDLADKTWVQLTKAKAENRPVIVGTAVTKALPKRIAALIDAKLLPPEAARRDWEADKMIEGHDQSAFDVTEEPLKKEVNGKLVTVKLANGKPKLQRWVYIRNPWGDFVAKGEAVHDPKSGKDEGLYRFKFEDVLAFFDQYYVGGPIRALDEKLAAVAALE